MLSSSLTFDPVTPVETQLVTKDDVRALTHTPTTPVPMTIAGFNTAAEFETYAPSNLILPVLVVDRLFTVAARDTPMNRLLFR